MYILYLYDCGMVGRNMCISVAIACIFVAYVVCFVFACKLCSRCESVVCSLYLYYLIIMCIYRVL